MYIDFSTIPNCLRNKNIMEDSEGSKTINLFLLQVDTFRLIL